MARYLTNKQEAFCQHYALNQDGARAYRVAYDADQMKSESVRVNAAKLLKHARVSLRIEELRKRVVEIAADKFDITAEKVLQELATIAFANVKDYVTVDDEGIPMPDFKNVSRQQFAAVGEVTFEDIDTGARTGKRVKFKLLDKKGALVDLGKHVGLFKETVKHEHEHNLIANAAQSLDDRIIQLVAHEEEAGIRRLAS
jgi:phage terminase small subunit